MKSGKITSCSLMKTGVIVSILLFVGTECLTPAAAGILSQNAGEMRISVSNGPLGIIEQYEFMMNERSLKVHKFIRFILVFGILLAVSVATSAIILLRHYCKGRFW